MGVISFQHVELATTAPTCVFNWSICVEAPQNVRSSLGNEALMVARSPALKGTWAPRSNMISQTKIIVGTLSASICQYTLHFGQPEGIPHTSLLLS